MLVDIIEHEAPNRSTILVNWMDEPYPVIEFGLRRKIEWLYVEYDILHKELIFLKLKPNFIMTSPKCKLEMVS